MRTACTAAVLVTLSVLSLSGRALAQPMDTYGLGSRSIAMGGAVTADVQDYSANYYNPAGLVRGSALRLGIGWFGAVHDLQVNGLSSNVDPMHGMTFARHGDEWRVIMSDEESKTLMLKDYLMAKPREPS